MLESVYCRDKKSDYIQLCVREEISSIDEFTETNSGHLQIKNERQPDTTRFTG